MNPGGDWSMRRNKIDVKCKKKEEERERSGRVRKRGGASGALTPQAPPCGGGEWKWRTAGSSHTTPVRRPERTPP